MFTLYPDSVDYDTKIVLDSIKTADQWAYILHDKEDAKQHYHVAIKFNNRRKLSTLIDEYGLWNYNPNNEDMFIKSWKGCLNYLIHNTKTSMNKYQYSEDEVISNIPEVIENLRHSKDNDDIFLEICDYIIQEDYPSFQKVLTYCRNKDDKYIKVLVNKKYSYQIDMLIKERTFR